MGCTFLLLIEPACAIGTSFTSFVVNLASLFFPTHHPVKITGAPKFKSCLPFPCASSPPAYQRTFCLVVLLYQAKLSCCIKLMPYYRLEPRLLVAACCLPFVKSCSSNTSDCRIRCTINTTTTSAPVSSLPLYAWICWRCTSDWWILIATPCWAEDTSKWINTTMITTYMQKIVCSVEWIASVLLQNPDEIEVNTIPSKEIVSIHDYLPKIRLLIRNMYQLPLTILFLRGFCDAVESAQRRICNHLSSGRISQSGFGRLEWHEAMSKWPVKT